jgi:SPP1 family phage portal protein
MSNLAKFLDRKISKSIRKRYKLFSCIAANNMDKEAWQDVEIKFTRNLPKNTLEEAQTASQLEGVVSKETQLSVLSIIDDVSEEIAKIKKEEKAAAAEAEKTENVILGFADKTDPTQQQQTEPGQEINNEQP